MGFDDSEKRQRENNSVISIKTPGQITSTPDSDTIHIDSLRESMQEKFLGEDVDPYGGEYLKFKNAQYNKQKATIQRLYLIISILFVESLILIISDVVQFLNYDDVRKIALFSSPSRVTQAGRFTVTTADLFFSLLEP